MMEQITLDMIPNGYTPTAHISQYDNGRHIRFNLQNINLAGNETVTLKIRKTNGELVTKIIENHTSYVEYVSEKADCDVSGKANSEIVISKDDVVIGSKNFFLNIEADPYDNAGVITETASGQIATFETNMADVLQEVKCEINATGGNGTPDNPNPINGYTEANITRCGVNLLGGETFADVIVDKVSDAVKNTTTKTVTYEAPKIRNVVIFDHFKANTQYTFFIDTNSGLPNLKIVYTDNSETELNVGATSSISGKSVKALSGSWQSGITVLKYDKFGIMEGVKALSDFTPYNGQTFTVAFGQTVYGGVLDVTRGKLTVTHDVVDLGSLPWNRTTSYTNPLFYVNLNTKKSDNITMICDIYSFAGNFNNASAFSVSDDNTIGSCYANEQIYVRNDAYTDKDAFKLAMSGKYALYPLATPFDIDLTPVQIEQLLGKNNVYHNCNGNTEVKYLYNA